MSYKLECTFWNGMQNKYQTYIVKDNEKGEEKIFESTLEVQEYIKDAYEVDKPYDTEMKFKTIEL
jgi:hypothetical protein